VASLLTGPLYGLVFDYTRHTKLIVLCGNLFEIGGQFISVNVHQYVFQELFQVILCILLLSQNIWFWPVDL